MSLQMTFGRQSSDGGEHTTWAVTTLGKNRAKALGGEGFGGGTDEVRILEALEESPSTVQDIASMIHISSGKVHRELNRLAKMGCVKHIGQGGGGE